MILFKISLVVWALIIISGVFQCFIIRGMSWKQFDKHLNDKYFT